MDCSIKWTVYGNKLKMFTTFVYIYINIYKKISFERAICDDVFSVSVYQLQLIFNKEFKMNRSSLNKFGNALFNQVSTESKETASSGQGDLSTSRKLTAAP